MFSKFQKFLITFLLFFLIGLLSTEKEHCNLYIDDDGYVCIETVDKKRTSNIWYHTEAFSISRCVYNPCAKQLHSGTATEFLVRDDLSASAEETYSNGIAYNTFRVHINELISGASPEWREEVQKALDGTGPAVYIRYDAIMYVYHGVIKWSGPYINTPPVDGLNPSELQGAEPWANPSGIATHYNRYLLIGKKKPDKIPEVSADELISADEKSPIEFWTGNSSDEFDLYSSSDPYSGIPSGEVVDNEAKASSWWGTTSVYARVKSSQDYKNIRGKYKIRYCWNEAIYEDEVVGVKDDGTEIIESVFQGYEEKETTKVIKDASFYYNAVDQNDNTIMIPVVAYEYLYNAKFYQLEQMAVFNDAMEACPVYGGADVPMTCYSTKAYENIASGDWFDDVEWLPDDKKHIKWAEVPENIDVYLFNGEKIWVGDPRLNRVNDEADEKYLEDRKSIMKYIFDNTKTKNDSLRIDEVNYLVGEGVPGFEPSVGVNWLTTDMENLSEKDIKHTFCTESASMKFPFKVNSINNAVVRTVQDSQSDILIPEATDNGKYYTAMKVTFSRKIKNDGQLERFAAGLGEYANLKGYSFASTINCGPLAGCSHGGLLGTISNSVKGHCLDGYKGIIFVHTPVISPFEVLDDIGGKTGNDGQLDPSEVRTDAAQLILDNYYVLDWTQTDHVNRRGYGYSATTDASGEEYSKYDKYTINKYVKFPFDVEYEGRYYDADTWIKVKPPETYTKSANFQIASSVNSYIPHSDNHWRKLVFYIPSYAKECGGMSDTTCYIKTLVEAHNVDSRFFEDHNPEEYWVIKEDGFSPDGWENAWEDRANVATQDGLAPTGARYATIYKDKIQLSGVIYDFTIVGSDDDYTFKYEDTGTRISGAVVPFCVYKWEKKVGTLNRYGDPAVRFRADGEISKINGEVKWDPVNTLALMPGKSNCWPNQGYLIKGTTFSYSFKTIANLGDSTKDYARITPSFRYYSPKTKTTTDNIKLYYNSNVFGNSMAFVEFNPTKDTSTDTRDWNNSNRRVFQLSDDQFNMSYYNYRNTSLTPIKYQYGDWISYTVENYNKLRGLSSSPSAMTEEEYMNKENKSYCLSDIYLASDTYLLSGEWEQLSRNTRGDGREQERLLTYAMIDGDWDGADAGEKWTYSTSQTKKFKRSMQTWYGQYFVPKDLYIVNLDDPETKQIIANAGMTPETFNLIDYMNAKGGNIRDDDEIFEGNTGYLIINFDIRTYNSVDERAATPHLRYYGGYEDMWKKEGFNPTPPPGIEDGPLEDGDIAIIDLNKSIEDRYKAGIFNIN